MAVQFGVLPGDARAIHEELRQAGQRRRPLFAQRDIDFQQRHRRAVRFGEQVVLFQARARNEVADGLERAQGGQILGRQRRFGDIGRKGVDELAVRRKQPHPEHISEAGDFEHELDLLARVRQRRNGVAAGLVVEILHGGHRIERLAVAAGDLGADVLAQMQGRPGDGGGEHRQGQANPQPPATTGIGKAELGLALAVASSRAWLFRR